MGLTSAPARVETTKIALTVAVTTAVAISHHPPLPLPPPPLPQLHNIFIKYTRQHVREHIQACRQAGRRVVSPQIQ